MAPGLYREKGMVFRMFLSALAATGSGEGSGGMLVMLVQMVPLILVFVVMYFIMIRPQKKKEKEVQAMRSGLQVGDEVITVGGIIGRVVSLRDDTVVIETGTDRSKLRICALLCRPTTPSTTTAPRNRIAAPGCPFPGVFFSMYDRQASRIELK